MLNIIQPGMKADTEAAIDALGKNAQVKKVFWTVFVGMAGACNGTRSRSCDSAACFHDRFPGILSLFF
jgi:hypothetical protein